MRPRAAGGDRRLGEAPLAPAPLSFALNEAVVDNDPRALIAALRNSHERLAALAAAVTDAQLTGPSYDKDWTVAQVFSHLGSGAEIALPASRASSAQPRAWVASAAASAAQPQDRVIPAPPWP